MSGATARESLLCVCDGKIEWGNCPVHDSPPPWEPFESDTVYPRPLPWRHERPGSFLLARIICRVFGHDWSWSQHPIDADNVFCSLEDAVEIAWVHGDCRRCWA